MPDVHTEPWATIVAFLRHPVLPILVIGVVAWIASEVATRAVRRVVKSLLDREVAEGTAQELTAVELQKRLDTIGGFAAAVVRAFIFLIAGVMVLRELELDIGPAIAGLGVVGIAVGFGAQSLVKDYFTGALILIENQFSIGDVVTIAGVSGVVEGYSLRRTTLRDIDGIVHSVPNGEIKVASNHTRGWARINLDLTVPYGTDIDQLTAVVDAVGRAMADEPAWHRRLLEAPRVEGVEALRDTGVLVRVMGTVRPTDLPAASAELRRRLLRAFAEAGIQLQGPQRLAAAAQAPADAPPS
jgi:moderate conductance mechanosensitive channel